MVSIIREPSANVIARGHIEDDTKTEDGNMILTQCFHEEQMQKDGEEVRYITRISARSTQRISESVKASIRIYSSEKEPSEESCVKVGSNPEKAEELGWKLEYKASKTKKINCYQQVCNDLLLYKDYQHKA